MIDARIFDEMAENLSRFLPPGTRELKDDFERNVKATMQSAMGKMDLVTREEFDVQAAVLLRTREKLEALEKRVTELEQRLD